MNGTNCRSALWGWPQSGAAVASGEEQPSGDAVFMNTSLSEAVLDDARVLGFFYDCSLTAASLVGTDLSHSQFVGPSDGNRFGRARLTACSRDSQSWRHSAENTVEERANNTGLQDRKGVPSTSDDDAGEICVWFPMLKADNEC